MSEPVRRWSVFTKRAVALILLLLLGLVLYRFREVLPPLMVAALLAFVLNPIVGFLVSRLHVSRGLATSIVFLALVVILLGALAAPVTAVPSIARFVRATQFDTIRIINDVGAFFDRPLEIGDYTLDLSGVYQELSSTLTSFVGSVAEGTLDVVFNIASGAFWLIVVLITSFYLVKDADRFSEQLNNLPPPGYRDDFVRLRQQITGVWNAFLRGQLLLGLVMVVITAVVCWTFGLSYAVVLGLLAGVMEFVPNVGPFIAGVPAVLVALFQDSTVFGLSNFWYAVLIAGLYLLIQQIENNVLVPRILGGSLNLHPLVVLIGIIIGGSMAGIIGMLLAAPILATLRVLGYYVFCRLYDRDPFAEWEPEAEVEPPKPGLIERVCKAAWCRFLAEIEQRQRDPIQIRPARASDRFTVGAISAQKPGSEDYIADVWDEWLSDPEGQLVVAKLGRQIVGLAKLSRLSGAEWWLEGLRVHPTHQRQGIGGRLQAHLIDKVRQIGPGTLRFGTHSLNEPVHRLAARDGFRHIATFQHYQAGPLPAAEAPPLRQLTEADLEAAWALTADSPRYQAGRGLYESFWTWQNLTRKRLARHLAAGDAWGLDAGEDTGGDESEDGNGRLSALALVPWIEDETMYIGYVDGVTGEVLVTILQGLRGLAAQQGHAAVRFKPVDEPTLTAAVEAAGYERHRDKDIWIFELQLQKETERV